MSKEKMNLQRFAEPYWLHANNHAFQAPQGEIREASAERFLFRRGTAYRKFNSVTQANKLSRHHAE